MWEKDEFDGKKSDIFSLGAVLFVLVAGHYGFVTSQENDKYYKHIRIRIIQNIGKCSKIMGFLKISKNYIKV